MPQLDRMAVTDWVSACEPSAAVGWVNLVQPLEEEPGAEAALCDMGGALDDAAAAGKLLKTLGEGDGRTDLHETLSQLGAARLLRLLRWLGCETGEDGVRALKAQFARRYGEDDPLRSIVQTLRRQSLLSRIFDEQRLDALLRASATAAGEST